MSCQQGHLRKMSVELADPVRYSLRFDSGELPLDGALGQVIRLQHDGSKQCVNCARVIKKTYNQGYCFPCSQKLAACDMCILRPQTCHYHLGTCREPEWGERNCLQPHIVYLANSSGLKVGITRQEQVPTRWIDQGATQAIPILAASSRLISGQLEVAIGAHVSDRTDWRKMLRGAAEPRDLGSARDELLGMCEQALAKISADHGDTAFSHLTAEPVDIEYPVNEYPEKVRSLNFDKHPDIESTLLGIKGQYLILESGVLNMRRHGGYHVTAQLG